jgi:hypothetical protein
MDDIENTHAERASQLINNFQARAGDILTSSAKSFATAMDALSTAHSEFIADLGALGATTATQISSRLDTTRHLQEELLHHFMGKVPLKEPVIKVVARKTMLPDTSEGPALDAQALTE